MLSCTGHDFVVDNIVHQLEAFDGLTLRDADKLQLQGARPIAVVEEEQP